MLSFPDFPIPSSITAAQEQQQKLRQRIHLSDDFPPPHSIAGVDVGYDLAGQRAHASIVLLRYPDLSILEQHQAFSPIQFPYVPGLLSFREIPAILFALQALQQMPDLLMVDGHGIAHPRRMGIATHLGLWLNRPAIGVAKSKLCGTYAPLADTKGAQSPLFHQGEQIGTVLRSKLRCNPLFISPGHRISHATAVNITQQAITRYRLPEPTRLADTLSKVKKR